MASDALCGRSSQSIHRLSVVGSMLTQDVGQSQSAASSRQQIGKYFSCVRYWVLAINNVFAWLCTTFLTSGRGFYCGSYSAIIMNIVDGTWFRVTYLQSWQSVAKPACWRLRNNPDELLVRYRTVPFFLNNIRAFSVSRLVLASRANVVYFPTFRTLKMCTI